MIRYCCHHGHFHPVITFLGVLKLTSQKMLQLA
jgi:hypothetical protein